LGKKLEANNIMVEKNIEDDLPSVFGNENQLEQVFINLFQNATDAFDRNQKDAKITIDIYLHGNCKSLIIDFSDNGMGIKKEIQEKIFEPFFTTKEVGKGTGVGLSIVYGIIREHRGEIICRSNSGLGTLFRMSFPT